MDDERVARIARHESYRTMAASLALLALTFLGCFTLLNRPLMWMAASATVDGVPFLQGPSDVVAFLVILVTTTLLVSAAGAFLLARSARRAAQSMAPSVGNE